MENAVSHDTSVRPTSPLALLSKTLTLVLVEPYVQQPISVRIRRAQIHLRNPLRGYTVDICLESASSSPKIVLELCPIYQPGSLPDLKHQGYNGIFFIFITANVNIVI